MFPQKDQGSAGNATLSKTPNNHIAFRAILDSDTSIKYEWCADRTGDFCCATSPLVPFLEYR